MAWLQPQLGDDCCLSTLIISSESTSPFELSASQDQSDGFGL